MHVYKNAVNPTKSYECMDFTKKGSEQEFVKLID